MALYLDAAKVLDGPTGQGSLKSRIYGPGADLKSKPALVYALISETAKYSTVLKEIIDNAGVLQYESKVSPLLALLLVHDLLFAKGGIAASAGHSLRQSVERHKARLQAELTKARLRRKCATMDALKDAIRQDHAALDAGANAIRWVRVNKSSVEDQLEGTFVGYRSVQSIAEVSTASPSTKVLTVDVNVPGLLGLPPDLNLTKSRAYLDGKLILQDKASCFPAYLLLGNSSAHVGDIVDACAAPGNKTTHLASLSGSSTIYACERNAARSETLRSMVKRTGCDNIQILARQDFLALNPRDPRFSNVTHLLLDPSCSGSGILRREDIPQLALPEDPRSSKKSLNGQQRAKKRKRQESPISPEPTVNIQGGEEHENDQVDAQSDTRLEKLSNLQTQIINHALQFPSATRVSYSTCSVNMRENEMVVARVLSDGKWKLLPRNEQVEGLANWPHRGIKSMPTLSSHHTSEYREQSTVRALAQDELDACIRCWPGREDCTMGFFACCFVRKDTPSSGRDRGEEEEWQGFSDCDAGHN